MNFNHDTGTVDTVLILDTTTAPALGGHTQTLEIIGSGALILPKGGDGTRPGTTVAGMLRYHDGNNKVEFWNNSSWVSFGTATGTVTSVDATGSTGLVVTGGPITSSGTLSLTLGTELQGLSALSANGIVARTAAGTYTSRTLTGTASNISVVNGDGIAGAPTFDLVNAGTPVTAQLVKITTDAKGRTTATTPVVAGDITSLVNATYVAKAGDSMASAANLTFSGGGEVLGLPITPSGSTAAASKAYVDNLVQGLTPKQSVRVATTAAGTLASSFANGQTVDGIVLATGNRILIKNQVAPAENGVYIVTAGAPTRASDADTWSELVSAYMFVEVGSTLADTAWVCTSDQGGTLNTTALTWVQFSGAGTYSAGTGLTLSGTTFSITAPIAPALGGTGTITAPSSGQVLVGTSGNVYAPATIASGTGITVTAGSGTLSIANAGVTSLTGTANQITVSASTGGITISQPANVTHGNLTLTSLAAANSFIYSGTGNLITATAAPTNGQLLIGSTGAAPVAGAITGGTGLQVTLGAGTIALANTGVTSVVSGTGINVSGATGAVTINNTGVTSVGLSITGPLYTISNSPVTTTGTLTATLATQNAGLVFAGPASGGAVAPTFRNLAYTDLTAGNALYLYRENASAPTAPTVAGTNASGFGSGAAASLFGSKAFANGAFATSGDAQMGVYVMRNITTTAAQTELFLDGVAATQRLVLPNNSLFTFSILVAARRTDTTGGGSGYRIDGVARKDATAGSVTLVGTPAKSILGETNTAWDVAVDVDTSTGALRVRVTGEASKTIRWVATVTTSETTN